MGIWGGVVGISMALFFSVIIGVPLGVISAVRQNSLLDYFLRVISLSGLALPAFWLGLLILMAFVAWFGTIPSVLIGGVGTLIAFATQPGNVALDGDGRNSPFTSALLTIMEQPGLSLSEVMISVRNEVLKTTAGKQVPWEHSSLTGGGTKSILMSSMYQSSLISLTSVRNRIRN